MSSIPAERNEDVTLDFAGADADNPWLAALAWAKSVYARQQRLSQRPLAECPNATLPKRLRPYLLMFDANGKPIGVHADRYEFWLYRQIRKCLKSGELYLDDSLQHRCFSDELVSMEERVDVLAQMDIPWMRRPIEAQLDALATELPHYSFDLDALYGAVDGQKFSVERPTVKARYSRKYFGHGKGVVAYTLLCNHVPLQGWLIGAHEFEAHHVFDI
jgi:hypothetical protein